MTFSITLPGVDFSNVTLPVGAIPTLIPETDSLEVAYQFYNEADFPPVSIGTGYTFPDATANGNDGTLSRDIQSGDEWTIADHGLIIPDPATAYAVGINTGYIRGPGPFTMVFCGEVNSGGSSYFMKSKGDNIGVSMLTSGGVGYQLNDGSNVSQNVLAHPAGTLGLFVMSSDGTTGLKFYDHTGATQEVTLTNPPTTLPDGSSEWHELMLFRDHATSKSQSYDGTVHYAGYFSTRLTDAGVTQLIAALRERLSAVGVNI